MSAEREELPPPPERGEEAWLPVCGSVLMTAGFNGAARLVLEKENGG